MKKSEHLVPFDAVKDMEKTPVNLVRRGVNQYWFEDTSKEIIGVL